MECRLSSRIKHGVWIGHEKGINLEIIVLTCITCQQPCSGHWCLRSSECNPSVLPNWESCTWANCSTLKSRDSLKAIVYLNSLVVGYKLNWRVTYKHNNKHYHLHTVIILVSTYSKSMRLFRRSHEYQNVRNSSVLLRLQFLLSLKKWRSLFSALREYGPV